MVKAKISFSFETVMSHPSRITFMQECQTEGFNTEMFFVSTESAEINIQRVASRVTAGGHGVPEEKIRKRYFRSLDLVIDAIPHCNKSFFFDNTDDFRLIGEVSGKGIFRPEKYYSTFSNLPKWFKIHVLYKL